MAQVIALSRFHAAAIALAKRGVPVFPCLPASKYPAAPHGFKDATTDLGQINKWWREDMFRNVAFATGAVSDIDVLDIDDGGETVLALLEEQHGQLPPTIEVISGSGGRHVYMKHIAGARTNIRGLGDGVDFKADNGYVLVPPSIHPGSQRPYVYSVDCADAIAEAPEWLAALIQKLMAANGSSNGNCKSAEEWHSIVASGVGEGRRNKTIASIVGHLLRRHVDLGVCYELALAFNAYRCTPPLTDGEVVTVVESIGKLELKRRGLEGGV